MGRLIERVEVEELDHDVVDHCEEMPTMGELYLIAVFDGEIFEVDELVVQNVDDSHFVGEGNQQVQARGMEGQGKWLLLVYFDDFEVVLLEVVPDAHSPIGRAGGH